MIGLDGYELSLGDAMMKFGAAAFARKDPREKCEILVRSWLGKRDGACVGACEFRPIAKRCGTLVRNFF